MTRLLDPKDYRRMPWANGLEITTEVARADAGGRMLWRLSMAQVVENGPFSAFDGIDRSLTVIDGPGFGLTGPDWHLRADPLVPVGFAGDVPVASVDVDGPALDFNVMWRRDAAEARVRVGTGAFAATGSVVAVLALSAQSITLNGAMFHVKQRGCILGTGAARITAEAQAIVVEIQTRT